jgi:histidinol-phosphatase (PHP family)
MPPNGEGEPFTIDGPEAEFENGLRGCFRGDIEALVNAYWDAEESLVSGAGFDILGHVDLIKKNNARGKYFSPASASYLNRIASLAESIAKSGIVAEVNTGGLNRGKTTELYPSPDFLRLLREKNVPVIITADAHRQEHLDGHYQDAVAELRKTGYTETLLFNGRQSGKSVWEKETLDE